MKIVALNGSPRKSWNIATLLGSALDGAASRGAETELIHRYDLNYKGWCNGFNRARLDKGVSAFSPGAAALYDIR